MLKYTDELGNDFLKNQPSTGYDYSSEAWGKYQDAMKAKNLASNSLTGGLHNLPGGTFLQSVINSGVGVAGNTADFITGQMNGTTSDFGNWANQYVQGNEMNMGEKPKADFSLDYIMNGLPRDTGNVVGSIGALAVPTAAAVFTAPAVGLSTGAGIATAGILSALGESAAEGGAKFRESLDSGDNVREAQEKSATVAGKNAGLLALTNLAGGALLNKAAKGIKNAYNAGKVESVTADSILTKLANSPKTDIAKGAGLLGAEAANEGVQEAVQQGISDSVENGKEYGYMPWSWNEEQQEAFKSTIGPMGVLGLAGGGARYTARKLGAMSADKALDEARTADKEEFFKAVGQQESGGDYTAQNSDTGALGKYQIMPDNWEPWSKEAGLEGADINDPQAQEAVARFKLGQYYDQFGPEGAMVAWYAGPSVAKAYVANPDDPAWENPQDNGPSIKDYVRQSIGRMDNPSDGGFVTTSLIGQTMNNGQNGCVEAVTKIGAELGNPWLSEQLSEGVVYVPKLVENAGDRVIPFDANKLEAGDIIVYGDDDHVVMYDGKGGYVGNSTSQNKVVAGEDYTQMGDGAPTKIIKTGGVKTNGTMSANSNNIGMQDYFKGTDTDDNSMSAREYLEKVFGSDDEKVTPEQKVAVQEVLESDDEQAISDMASNLGWTQTATNNGTMSMPQIRNQVMNSGKVSFDDSAKADEFASTELGQQMQRNGNEFTATNEVLSKLDRDSRVDAMLANIANKGYESHMSEQIAPQVETAQDTTEVAQPKQEDVTSIYRNRIVDGMQNSNSPSDMALKMNNAAKDLLKDESIPMEQKYAFMNDLLGFLDSVMTQGAKMGGDMSPVRVFMDSVQQTLGNWGRPQGQPAYNQPAPARNPQIDLQPLSQDTQNSLNNFASGMMNTEYGEQSTGNPKNAKPASEANRKYDLHTVQGYSEMIDMLAMRFAPVDLAKRYAKLSASILKEEYITPRDKAMLLGKMVNNLKEYVEYNKISNQYSADDMSKVERTIKSINGAIKQLPIADVNNQSDNLSTDNRQLPNSENSTPQKAVEGADNIPNDETVAGKNNNAQNQSTSPQEGMAKNNPKNEGFTGPKLNNVEGLTDSELAELENSGIRFTHTGRLVDGKPVYDLTFASKEDMDRFTDEVYGESEDTGENLDEEMVAKHSLEKEDVAIEDIAGVNSDDLEEIASSGIQFVASSKIISGIPVYKISFASEMERNKFHAKLYDITKKNSTDDSTREYQPAITSEDGYDRDVVVRAAKSVIAMLKKANITVEMDLDRVLATYFPTHSYREFAKETGEEFDDTYTNESLLNIIEKAKKALAEGYEIASKVDFIVAASEAGMKYAKGFLTLKHYNEILDTVMQYIDKDTLVVGGHEESRFKPITLSNDFLSSLNADEYETVDGIVREINRFASIADNTSWFDGLKFINNIIDDIVKTVVCCKLSPTSNNVLSEKNALVLCDAINKMATKEMGLKNVLSNGELKKKIKDKLDGAKHMGVGDIQPFLTVQGEVYGFYSRGKIFLDPNHLNANTPIHEMVHLWDAVIRKLNPELWKQGVELLKQTSMWKEMSNHSGYARIKNDENRLASEVHARLSGNIGAVKLYEMAQSSSTDKGVIQKFKNWVKKYWAALKDHFTKWDSDRAKKITLDEFINMPLADLANGVNLGELQKQIGTSDTVQMYIGEVENLVENDTAMKDRIDRNIDNIRTAYHNALTSLIAKGKINPDDTIGEFRELLINEMNGMELIRKLASRYNNFVTTNDLHNQKVFHDLEVMAITALDDLRGGFNNAETTTDIIRLLADSGFRAEESSLLGDLQEIRDRINEGGYGYAYECSSSKVPVKYQHKIKLVQIVERELVENGTIADRKAKDRHSRQSASFIAENPNHSDTLKAEGNTKTRLDNLPKISVVRLRKSEQMIQKFGKALGVPVHFVENKDAGNRGVFTHNGEIFINRKGNVPVRDIFVHEFVHWLKASEYNSGMYDALVASIEGQNGPISEARTERYAKGIFDSKNMTTEEILEEMVCDAIAHTESSRTLMQAIMNTNTSLGTKILGNLWSVWNTLSKIVGYNKARLVKEQNLPNGFNADEMAKLNATFSKLLLSVRNTDGKPIFKIKDGEMVVAQNGEAVHNVFPAKTIQAYSSEKRLDENQRQDDNVSIEFPNDTEVSQQVFDKYLNDGLKSIVRQQVAKEIVENIHNFDELSDPVKMDKAFAKLPSVKRMRIWFNNKTISSNEGYKDRLAARYEYARRCFLYDSRIPNGLVRQTDNDQQQRRISGTPTPSISQYADRGERQSDEGIGITVTPTQGEYKNIKEHFDTLVEKNNLNEKRSQQNAFSIAEKRNKYSRSATPTANPPSSNLGKLYEKSIGRLLRKMSGGQQIDNLEVEGRKTKDNEITVIQQYARSPMEIARKNPLVAPFVILGKKAERVQEKLRAEFNESMNDIEKTLGYKEWGKNDAKYRQRKEALNNIMLQGDEERKVYTEQELKADGHDEATIAAYKKMRDMMEKAWQLVNKAKTGTTYHSKELSESEFEALKKDNPFIEQITKAPSKNTANKFVYSWKEPTVYKTVDKPMQNEEIAELMKNPDVRILRKRALPTGSKSYGDYLVDYVQKNADLGKIEGYIPHIFHGWNVFQVDVQGNMLRDMGGNPIIAHTAKSMKDAVKEGKKIAEANKDKHYKVMPQVFEVPGASEMAAVMGDYDYFATINKVSKDLNMTLSEAEAFMADKVKMKNRSRFFGHMVGRKGVKGFEQNVFVATQMYLNQASRYVAMNPFKRRAFTQYERMFGDIDNTKVTEGSRTAKWIREYIMDMNGIPNYWEKVINDFMHEYGVGKEVAGGRPSLGFALAMTYPMTIAKLGLFNVGSALMNLTQLFNLYGAMGTFTPGMMKGAKQAVQAWKNPDSPLGKLLYEELGLKYQIGVDLAGGYSRAEMGGIAAMQGFAKRMAGKSMVAFRASDTFGRGTTLMTAYNKAIEEGKSHEDAVKYANEINDKVNFDYSTADAPYMFRMLGPISTVLLQFKKYPVKQLELFYDIFTDGREQGLNRAQASARLAKYMLPYVVCSGMMGVPFLSMFGGILSALIGIATGDDDWDWEQKMKAMLINEFGEDSAMAQGIMYGIGAPLAGINIGSRVGVGDFMGVSTQKRSVGDMLFDSTTLTSSIHQAVKQFGYGNYAEMVKAINPSLGNILVAARGKSLTTRGRVKYEYQNDYERFVRIIGYNPVNESLAGDLASKDYVEKNEQRSAKEKAVDDFIENPSAENAKALNEFGVTPATIKNEVARRKMNRHDLNELDKKKKEEKAKNKKPKTYSSNDYLKEIKK